MSQNPLYHGRRATLPRPTGTNIESSALIETALMVRRYDQFVNFPAGYTTRPYLLSTG
jgi:hypothetical protein